MVNGFESKLVDHMDGSKLFNEITSGKTDTVACNVISLLKDLFTTIAQMQNDITQLKADVSTLEGLIK